MHRLSWPLLWTLVAAAAMVSCGGSGSPAAPSTLGGGVTLQGVVLQGTAGASSQPGRVAALDAGGGHITVSVQGNSSISTTVSANGTFELDGLPQTGFTLVFSVNGVSVGTVTISPVQGSNKVRIVVQVTTTTVVLVNLDLGDANENENEPGGTPSTCLIEDGKVGKHVELEGTVDSGTGSHFMLKVNGKLVDVTPANGVVFKCEEDKTSSTTCQASLKTGSKVHVRGTLMSCSTTAAAVTATQVEVEKADGSGGEGDGE